MAITRFKGFYTVYYPDRPASDRFWEKVNKSGPVPEHVPELGNCWIWTACKAKKKDGKLDYGHFRFEGKIETAHRMSWILANGNIPDGMLVLHRCDNPTCVRITHLFLGSSNDNAQDCLAKGRVKFGVGSGRAVINDETVRKIRSLYVPKMFGCRKIAKLLNVSEPAVNGVVFQNHWSHVT